MPSSDEPLPILPARLPKSAVRKTYTWIAPIHDMLAVLVEARARRLGLAWADGQDGETILEVAVGTGLSFQHLLQQNPHGWTEGIDWTPAMLRRAERRARHANTDRYRLRLGDALALDFEDATFDLVLCSYMFDMLPEDDFLVGLRGFWRVLKPGGRLVMMNMTRGERWYNHLWDGLYRLHPPLLGGCRGIALEPYFKQAGFGKVRRAYISQLTFPSEVVYGVKP